jgi:hypothetical protein
MALSVMGKRIQIFVRTCLLVSIETKCGGGVVSQYLFSTYCGGYK